MASLLARGLRAALASSNPLEGTDREAPTHPNRERVPVKLALEIVALAQRILG